MKENRNLSTKLMHEYHQNLNQDSKIEDSMRFVTAEITDEQANLEEDSCRIFFLYRFKLPAIADWGLLESKFRDMRRDKKDTKGYYVRFDDEVMITSRDFFGVNKRRVYKYALMDHLRQVGANAYSFVIGQTCFAFFLVDANSRHGLGFGNRMINLIQSKIDNFEKNLYEGVNLYKLTDIDLSEKLGPFGLEMKETNLTYNYNIEKKDALANGKRVGHGRKKSVEFDEDLF